MIKKIVYILKRHFYRPKWKDIEYFDESWKIRIKKMAELIENEKIILDLGCGKMWLKQYLDVSKVYIGCDYVKRDNDTILCDFNKMEFPDLTVDLCFVSGCLEYVENVDWFLNKITECASSIVISYCTIELNPDVSVRKSWGWVNHMSLSELIRLLKTRGFSLVKTAAVVDGNEIMKFVKTELL